MPSNLGSSPNMRINKLGLFRDLVYIFIDSVVYKSPRSMELHCIVLLVWATAMLLELTEVLIIIIKKDFVSCQFSVVIMIMINISGFLLKKIIDRRSKTTNVKMNKTKQKNAPTPRGGGTPRTWNTST